MQETEEELDFSDGYDDTCGRCNCCSATWEDCWSCGGNGGEDGEDLMMEDPLWYGPDDWRECDICKGQGGWPVCIGNCDSEGQHNNQKYNNLNP